MSRRWSQVVATAVILILALAVVLISNRAGQGQQATTSPRPATVIAAAPTTTALRAITQTTSAGPATTTPTRALTPTRTATSAARATNPPTATARAQAPTPTPDGKLATIAFAQLPREAQQTITLIDQGGPFPYDRDGVVFENRERLLPIQANGYYHEYTVVTPGSSDRGARRIIAGRDGELYYTDDHYESFRRVVR